MSAKRKDEVRPEGDRLIQGRDRKSGTFVTFRNGHMYLDVRSYLTSREGKASVERVIELSEGVPKKSKKPLTDDKTKQK